MRQSLLPVADSGNGNLLCAQSCTLTQTATLQSLSFYVRVANGNLALGLYNSNGFRTAPGALLAQTRSFRPVNGWNTVAVSSGVLQPGTYWLAYLPSSNSLGFWNGFSGSEVHVSQNFGPLPNFFPSFGSRRGGDHWSIFATFVLVNPTPTPAPTPNPTPTPTPSPSATPTPTPTPAPTPTPTPAPTPTPTPAPTPTPTPTPSPTPPVQAPTIVQHVSSAANNNVSYIAGHGNPGNPFYINLPNPTQAGNCVILSSIPIRATERYQSLTTNRIRGH